MEPITLQVIAEREAQTKKVLEAYKKGIVSKIKKSEIPGVKEQTPHCATVSASEFIQTGIWSAEYYLKENQADLVKKTLAPKKTATDCLAAINKMIASKKSSDGQYLNETTLNILREYVQ